MGPRYTMTFAYHEFLALDSLKKQRIIGPETESLRQLGR
jgi:hypothetical protein